MRVIHLLGIMCIFVYNASMSNVQLSGILDTNKLYASELTAIIGIIDIVDVIDVIAVCSL